MVNSGYMSRYRKTLERCLLIGPLLLVSAHPGIERRLVY